MSSREAVVWIHGVPARSWERVAEYLTGDAHDRSKVEVLVGGKFYDLALQPVCTLACTGPRHRPECEMAGLIRYSQ